MRLNEFLAWRSAKLAPFANDYALAKAEELYVKTNLDCALKKAYENPTDTGITNVIINLKDRYETCYAQLLLTKDAFEQAQKKHTIELCKTEKVYGEEQC